MIRKAVLFLVLSVFWAFSIHGAIPANERAALIAFYNATNGDDWDDNSGWKGNNDEPDGFSQIGSEGTWRGITVEADTVTEIYFWENNLNGYLPPEIANLANLEKLDISGYDLSGSLPPGIGNLSDLEYLDLSGTSLSGNLPPELGYLGNLGCLNLSYTDFSGTIPPEIWNLGSLEYLDLTSTHFSGSIPPELGNLGSLKELYLYDTGFTGSIPPELANLNQLTILGLSGANLTGGIPPELGNISSLKELYLFGNKLTGGIPVELANLTQLTNLSLGGNDLTGGIPPEFGNLINLKTLGSYGAKLSGSIPPQLGNLVNLDFFVLTGTTISGSIPPEIGNLTNLWYLDLSNNELTGSIPKEIGNMGGLCGGELWLNNNRLSGTLPEELVDLSPEFLFLQGNRFSGPIPDHFLNYGFIGYIILGYNSLYTDNPVLQAFLDSYSPGWSDTQTIAPKGLAAAPVSSTSIKVSWTPIVYTEDAGGYKVLYSTTPGEPYIEAGITSGKSVSEFVVTGLLPGTTYYFVVRTQTDPHEHNKNTLLSPYSAEVSAVTLVSNSIIVEPMELHFESFIGTTESQTQTFTISYGGAGPYGWSASCDEEWFSVTPVSGTGPAVVTVSVDPSGLALGTYTGTVTVSDPHVVNSPQTVSVYLEIKEAPIMILNRDQLYFGAISGGTTPPPQSFTISYSDTGIFNWNASSSASWLSVNPSSGTGAAALTVSVDPSGLAAGTYSGTITLSDANAANSPLFVSVQFIVKEAAQNQAPFGSFDTPISGTTVYGSIPVTGWALDDTAVESVKIYRAPVGGEPGGMVYIGDAVFVEGARPDIEQAYPYYPMNYKAGWGYMMLTNFLPDGGNGTFTLYAYARDPEGNKTTLGQKTIICNNADAVKPFGAIDTPGQGGSASGSSFVNFGWALTPQPNTIPFDGSTISVIIDGVNVGHPVYNNYREDIATLFPGYANSDGAVGYFYIDTTKYADRVHTISWVVTDDAGNTDGIGSRYFTIYNGTSDQFSVASLKDYDLDGEPKIFYPDDADNMTIEIAQLERIVVDVGVRNIAHVPSFNLPVGSTLDMERGIFYWQPGPGFIGFYSFEFIGKDKNDRSCKRVLNINISPKFRIKN